MDAGVSALANAAAPAARARLSLEAMRALATFLLIAMSALYVTAVLNREASPLWGYARAFAEAAMVGGLADWFAVTALFRRPLGLPIPHTAIIPRSKDRIARALGEFVALNFLTPSVVALRLAEQDVAAALARQISEPGAARKIADGLVNALPPVLDLLGDETVAEFLRRQIADLSKDARLAGALGRTLRLLTDHGRHQPVLDAALNEGWRALEENEAAIRAQVRARTGWMWRLVSLDARAADALIGAIEDALRDAANDPDHPARQRITELLHRFADDLQNSPALRAQIERIVFETLAHPAVASFLNDVWRDAKAMLRQTAAAENAALREAMADAIERLGAAMLADAEVRQSLNARLRAILVELAARHGQDISRLISETIQSWDTRTVVEKLEQNVGPDLQYIRINGTLIGGLVGLVIHQVTLFLIS